MRPRLPDSTALLPYLQRIDQSQVYSNFGPLAQEFQERLADRFGVERDCILSLGSGTAGLIAALLALDVPRGSLCMAPDWTFPGTINAILAAGLVPFLVDVDPDAWALTPAIAERALAAAPALVSAVMPVSPFGAPLPMDQWEAFRRETGIPVVVDAAAAFDGATASWVPQVISLHATKAFGIGEGGLLLCRDPAFVAAVRAASNFGFAGARVPSGHAINGKLSEYHAAVGLAALDVWPARRHRLIGVIQTLGAAVADRAGSAAVAAPSASWATSTFQVLLESRGAVGTVGRLMRRGGIETRRWWPVLMHDQAPFLGCPHRPAPVARTLRDRVLGLPLFEEMTEGDIDRVATALIAALSQVPAKSGRATASVGGTAM